MDLVLGNRISDENENPHVRVVLAGVDHDSVDHSSDVCRYGGARESRRCRRHPIGARLRSHASATSTNSALWPAGPNGGDKPSPVHNSPEKAAAFLRLLDLTIGNAEREAEHAVLLIPFSWSIDQPGQSDAARQPALDRGFD